VDEECEIEIDKNIKKICLWYKLLLCKNTSTAQKFEVSCAFFLLRKWYKMKSHLTWLWGVVEPFLRTTNIESPLCVALIGTFLCTYIASPDSSEGAVVDVVVVRTAGLNGAWRVDGDVFSVAKKAYGRVPSLPVSSGGHGRSNGPIRCSQAVQVVDA
jgi:hypothetical protein